MTTPLPALAELAKDSIDPASGRYIWEKLRRLEQACTPETILALAAEVEALKQDAKRYRYIRDVPWYGTGTPLERVIGFQRNAHWDAAIDADRTDRSST